MAISFVTTRELSKQPGKVLKRLKKEGPQIVTQNGQPAGILIPSSSMGIEADLEAIRRIVFGQGVAALQQAAAIAGTDRCSVAEIDAEISSVRRKRRA